MENQLKLFDFFYNSYLFMDFVYYMKDTKNKIQEIYL